MPFDYQAELDETNESPHRPRRRRDEEMQQMGWIWVAVPLLLVIAAAVLWLLVLRPRAVPTPTPIPAIRVTTPTSTPKLLTQTLTVPTATSVIPTATPAVVQTPTPSQKIVIGGYVEVFGTGSDKLRLRTGPGLNYVTWKIVPDGTRFKVAGGPREADGYVWWSLVDLSDGTEGWAVENFLKPTTAP